jgi:hypothetical protein
MPVLENRGIVNRDSSGNLTMAYEHGSWFESFVPMFSAARRLVPTAADPKSQDRWLLNLTNWTAGPGLRRVTPEDRYWAEYWQQQNLANR